MYFCVPVAPTTSPDCSVDIGHQRRPWWTITDVAFGGCGQSGQRLGSTASGRTRRRHRPRPGDAEPHSRRLPAEPQPDGSEDPVRLASRPELPGTPRTPFHCTPEMTVGARPARFMISRARRTRNAIAHPATHRPRQLAPPPVPSGRASGLLRHRCARCAAGPPDGREVSGIRRARCRC